MSVSMRDTTHRHTRRALENVNKCKQTHLKNHHNNVSHTNTHIHKHTNTLTLTLTQSSTSVTIFISELLMLVVLRVKPLTCFSHGSQNFLSVAIPSNCSKYIVDAFTNIYINCCYCTKVEISSKRRLLSAYR